MGILFDSVKMIAGYGEIPLMVEELKIKTGNGKLFLNGEQIAECKNVQFTMKRTHDDPRPMAARYRPVIYMREEPARAAGRKEQSNHESNG